MLVILGGADHSWELVRICQLLDSIPDLLNEKLWKEAVECVLTSLPGGPDRAIG